MHEKKDYVVSSYDNSDEKIFDNLTEARKFARKNSKNSSVVINCWLYDADMDDMVLDEKFEIKYENGAEIK